MLKEISISTFFFIFLFSFSVYSLGIGPSGPISMPDVNFEPNLTIERNMFVINDQDYPFPVEMELGGNLTEYATLSEYNFTLAPKDESGSVKPIKFTLTLPEKLEKPGAYLVAIRAAQVVGGVPSQAGALGGKVKVAVGFYVHVPYPGKYLEADMKIENTEVNKTILFIIDAINRGNETIGTAQGTIRIYDAAGKFIVTLKTDAKSVASKEQVEMKAEWPAFGINPGEYYAAVGIDYDGSKTTFQKGFRIGSPTAKILNVSAEPIVNGTIGTIETEVISYWNKNIEDAYVTVTVSKDGYDLTTKSPSIVLNPWKKIKFTNFWDTSNAKGPGEYQGIATLHYMNKTDSMEFTLIVKEPEFVFPDITLLLVIILIIIFAVMVLYTARRRKRKYIQKKLA